MSNELGSGHPRAAMYSVFVTVAESLLIGLISMAIVIVAKDHFAVFFTDSVKMQKAVSNLAYLLAATMLLNSVQPVISGTLFFFFFFFFIWSADIPIFLSLYFIYRSGCGRRLASTCGIH